MKKNPHKYIFVVGGVMSGVGKGIATSSIARILEAHGVHVNVAKADPYLNVDAGTMNPTEHGEVFVLESGLETDQDMGNYERFLNRSLSPHDYMTGGMVYQSVIERERALKYKGKCVEAVPHVRDEIMARYKAGAVHSKSDVTLIEIGGTIGDFQNALFLDAARVLALTHPGDVLFVMVSYLPVPGKLGEMKTRPTQHAIAQLRSYGVEPHFLVCRSSYALDAKRKEKLALASNLNVDHIISAPDVDSIYSVPLLYERDGFGRALLKRLSLSQKKQANFREWKKFLFGLTHTTQDVRIAIVGKYFDTGNFVLSDAYLSVIEALTFSGAKLRVKPVVSWVNAKDILEQGAARALQGFDGILVPGGFGETGIEGKIAAIEYARISKIPYFGLCYGMQLMLIEYARHMLGLRGAHTTEIDTRTPHPVIDFIPEQKELVKGKRYGGTMRLGLYPADIEKGTHARGAYGAARVFERHRHRYEVNQAYIDTFEKGGIIFSGRSPDRVLMEIAELPKTAHPFFLGVQFHPEFQARPLSPHPLFTAFLRACSKKT